MCQAVLDRQGNYQNNQCANERVRGEQGRGSIIEISSPIGQTMFFFTPAWLLLVSCVSTWGTSSRPQGSQGDVRFLKTTVAFLTCFIYLGAVGARLTASPSRIPPLGTPQSHIPRDILPISLVCFVLNLGKHVGIIRATPASQKDNK